MSDKWSTIRRELVRAAHCNITLRPYEEAHALIDEIARELADKLSLLTPAHAKVLARMEVWATARTENPLSGIECDAADDLLAALAALRAQEEAL